MQVQQAWDHPVNLEHLHWQLDTGQLGKAKSVHGIDILWAFGLPAGAGVAVAAGAVATAKAVGRVSSIEFVDEIVLLDGRE